MQQHFDSIEINVKGDREIAFSETVSLTEQELAGFLKIRGTPTLLLLNNDNKIVLRLSGYRSVEALQQAFNFVVQKAYLNTTFTEFKRQNMNYARYQFIEDPLIETVNNFSAIKRPVALLFEDDDCNECARFHNKLISQGC